MFPANSDSNNRTAQQPVFIVSHSKQEEVCKEVYEYIVCKKIQKLKEAVLQFNSIIKKMLK